MSQRGDRGEGHARRPGRSSSFGGHRGGGVGSAGKGGAGSSGQPPLSSNRSFRKPGNGHGGHQRVVNQPDTTGFQPAPAPDPHQTPARPPPAPQNAAVHVPISVPRPQHQDPQVSSSLSASENPANPPLPKATHAAPRAPPKGNPPLPQGGSKDLLSEGFTTIVWPRRIPGFNACLARVIPAPRPRTASASRSPSSTRSRSARPLREFLDQANSVHAAGSCAAVEYRERGVFNASKMLAQI